MDLEDYISAFAGPAMSWIGNQGVAQRRNAINDQSTLYKMGQSGRQMDATNKLLTNTVAPSAVMANDAAAKATLTDNIGRTIDANKAYEQGPNFGGKMTGDYAARFASNNQDIAGKIQRAIDQFSSINAPAVRRQGDAIAFSNAGNTVAQAGTAAKNVGARYDAAIDSVRPNPLLAYGSQLANGFNLARAKNKLQSNALTDGIADTGTYANNDWMSA